MIKTMFVFLFLVCHFGWTYGFVSVSASQKSKRSMLFVSNDNKDLDREFIRQQIETILNDNNKNGKHNIPDIAHLLSQVNATEMEEAEEEVLELPPSFVAPPLTSMERIYREQEMALLQQLSESDGALTDLRNIWNSERGNALHRPNELHHQQCDESTLWNIIREQGFHFVQPVHLLAKLYAQQGRHKEARFLWTKIVLPTKPWHVDALRGVIKSCVQMRDYDAARTLAQQSLPDLISSSSSAPFAGGCINPKRKEWVEKAVGHAELSFREAEERTLSFFDDERDAWQ